MADAMPDYHLEQQRLRMQVSSLALNLERYKLEIIECESRKKTALENIEATMEAIAEHRERLASLVETHGEMALDLERLRKETENG